MGRGEVDVMVGTSDIALTEVNPVVWDGPLTLGMFGKRSLAMFNDACGTHLQCLLASSSLLAVTPLK